MRALGAVALAVLAALAAWLAVANRDAVMFSVDALRPGADGAAIRVPLFAVMLLGVLLGLIVGAAYMAVPQVRLRRQLREERARADRLQRLLADETLAKHDTAPVRPLLSRISG
jgi:uncharacterized integral membrane protein